MNKNINDECVKKNDKNIQEPDESKIYADSSLDKELEENQIILE